MRILVTGARGFVGSRVWPLFTAAGHEVFAVARRPPIGTGQNVTWLESDLLQPGEPERVAGMARADALVHLVWTVEHGKFWIDPANLDWIAVSLALAKAFAANGGRRIVAAGTCFEYDWPTNSDCVENVTPLAGHTLYDISKSSLRAVLDTWADQNGLSFAWARLFYLYGAGEHPDRLVADVARNVVAGRPVDCSSGRALRDFMDVRDAGAAIAALALSDVTGAVNIGSGEAISIAGIARTIGEIAGRPELVRIGTRPDRDGEPLRIVADVGRLKREVDFVPKTGFMNGVTDALEFWRALARRHEP